MTEGKILEWKVKVGDSFDVGDALFSIETDKATMDYEATEKGVLAKVINDGTTSLPIGTPVAIFTKKKEDVGKFSDFTLDSASKPSAPSERQSPTQATQTQQAPSQTTTQPTSTSSSGERVFASPLAKTIAQQKGINLS